MANVVRNYLLNGILLRSVNCRRFSVHKRPELYSTPKISTFQYGLLVVPASAFMLGVWQVFRWRQKLQLIDMLQSRPNSQPVSLQNNIQRLHELEFYPVEVRGEYDHSRECYIGPRTLIKDNGVKPADSLMTVRQETGYLLVTPLRLSDNSGEILVNRGWVASSQANPSSDVDRPVGGVEIRGLIRTTDRADNSGTMYTGRRFMYRHVERMADLLQTSPVFIDMCSPPGPHINTMFRRTPIPDQTNLQQSNSHVSYFITWFSLTLVTLAGWYSQFSPMLKSKLVKLKR